MVLKVTPRQPSICYGSRWLTISMIAGRIRHGVDRATGASVAHAIGMAVLQAAMTFVAMLAARDATQPLWFWLGGIALMVPAAWVGARLRSSRQRA